MNIEEQPDDLKPSQYRIPTSIRGVVVGQVRCSRPGLRLIDFYRTSNVLAKDVPPKPVDKPTP